MTEPIVVTPAPATGAATMLEARLDPGALVVVQRTPGKKYVGVLKP